MTDTLASYPYVIVRLACTMCSRKGSYRLARLAEKYGAQIDMRQLLEFLGKDAPSNSSRSFLASLISIGAKRGLARPCTI